MCLENLVSDSFLYNVGFIRYILDYFLVTETRSENENNKVSIRENERTWGTSYKLNKQTGFIADQTILKTKHRLVTYSILVKHILFSLGKIRLNLMQKFVV